MLRITCASLEPVLSQMRALSPRGGVGLEALEDKEEPKQEIFLCCVNHAVSLGEHLPFGKVYFQGLW